MTNKFPITTLAQLEDITVFQTIAFKTKALGQKRQEISQQMYQLGQASYGELNLGLHVNDAAAQVLDNRMCLLAAINEQLKSQQRLPIKSLHWVNQVHGKQIYDVDSKALSMHTTDADAIVSQQAGLGLAIMTADCVPVVLYQPTSGQIAAIHAGWQGLAYGVIKATAERFTTSGQIVAWIGACISQPNYEVAIHVRDQLLAGCVKNQSLTPSSIDNFNQLYCMAADANLDIVARTDTDTHVERSHKRVDTLTNHATGGTDKIKLNLPKLANDQLVAVGITVCTDLPVGCSYADAHYYSYRRQTHLQQPATGRMALIIVRSLPMMHIDNN